MSIGLCPDCGKLISFHFPVHDCVPTPNKKRELQRAKRKKVKRKQKGERRLSTRVGHGCAVRQQGCGR